MLRKGPLDVSCIMLGVPPGARLVSLAVTVDRVRSAILVLGVFLVFAYREVADGCSQTQDLS